MRKTRLILLILLFSLGLYAEKKNRDKPLYGFWDFKLETLWEIDEAGEDVFGHPFTLTVGEGTNLYVFDMKHGINYIFDPQGDFIRTFGRGGQGPGEIIGQEWTHIVEDKLIIPGMNGIHYFTLEGEYIKTIGQERNFHNPRLFIDEDNMIGAPMTAVFLPEGRAEIVRKNLKTDEEIVLADFSLSLAGVASTERQVVDIIVIGLSPLMTLALSDNTLLWGLSDSYLINISDLQGNLLDKFSVKRKKRKISDSTKTKYFRNMNMSPEMLSQLVQSFANLKTHFCRFEIHRGLIYVFVPDLDVEQGQAKIKQIDIFSRSGQYLYRAELDFGENLTHFFSPLRNVVFCGDFVYAACTRKDDTVVILKCKGSFPEGPSDSK